jgi:S-layer protein
MAIQGFDKEFYLNAKLAQLQSDSATAADWADKDAAFLEARFSAVGLTAVEHYEQYGYKEELAPNAFFNPAEYIRAKATDMFNDPASSYLTIDEAAADFVAIWNGNVYNHYLQYGDEEGINPSNSFDVSAYLEAKLADLQADEATAAEWAGKSVADVAAAFKDAGITALGHFTAYGQNEGLSAPAVPADEQVNVDTSVPGQVFTLTADQDTLTGTAGNDTFTSGVVQTANAGLQDSLQSVDSIDGGAGNDTLNVTLNQGVVVSPSLSSVEQVNLRITDAASSLSLAGATGVTGVTVQNSTVASTAATGTVSSVGAANLGVKNQNTAVSFDGSTATTLGLTLENVGTGGATGTHTDVDLGLVAAAKATTLDITANNANADVIATQAGVVTTVNVAATGANELGLNDAAGTATTVNVTGEGSVDFVTNGVALTAVKTLTAADGGVTVDATAGVLETATTGAGKDTITAVGANVKNISTGAGDDTVSIVASALTATSVVDLGAGNDTLTLSTAPTAGATLTGGEGTDTLAVAAADYATTAGYSAANLAKITGFEVLSLTDAGGATGTTDLSKIAGLTSFQAKGVATGGATVSNVGADAAVILKGDLATNTGALTVSLKDATGSSDVLNLTLNADYAEDNTGATATIAAVTETVTASGVETLNVTSTGTASTPFLGATGTVADGVNNTLALTNDDLVTLNVAGDQAITFNSVATMTNLANIDASANTGGATISAAAAATDGSASALTITGSATAANSLTGSGNADTISGGAGNDTITGGAKGDMLSGGEGNDTFVFAAGDSSIGTGAFDTITDFNANTFGSGADGAAGDGTTAGAQADWTGDVLRFAADTDTATGGVKADVLGSAADATTFLSNNAGSAEGLVAALDSSTGNLYVDNTNDGIADFFIQLQGVTTIDEAAFVLV